MLLVYSTSDALPAAVLGLRLRFRSAALADEVEVLQTMLQRIAGTEAPAKSSPTSSIQLWDTKGTPGRINEIHAVIGF